MPSVANLETVRRGAVLVVRESALPLAHCIAERMGATVEYSPSPDEKPVDYFRAHFRDYNYWIMIMSTGIAVRFLSGLPEDKRTDPAVVVLDEGCHHAISLLSGHEGKANELANAVANLVSAAPVISTATEALKNLVVGIGCRRGVTGKQVEVAVTQALAQHGLSIGEIRCMATIRAKADEPGLNAFCWEHNLPLRIFEHEDVAARNWVAAPSEWVKQNIGLDGVCEPCALMATPRGRLVIPKTTCDGVAIAVVEDSVRSLGANTHQSLKNSSDSTRANSSGSGSLRMVSVGPGFPEHITPSAMEAILDAEVIVSYELYLRWVQPWLTTKQTVITLPLTQEKERAAAALQAAREGRKAIILSSGDIGVYAMASLVFDDMLESDEFSVEVVPGITSANSSASLLGAPMSHDYATLSLSDLLCPWNWIEDRANHIAASDLCVALYNVQSKQRPDGVYKILDIMLEHKNPETLCGIVRNGYRPGQEVSICTLAELSRMKFDMLTTVIIGNRFTRRKRNWIYTPRGYNDWPSEPHTSLQINVLRESGSVDKAPCSDAALSDAVWVFSGTADGNGLASQIVERGCKTVISTATEYGARNAWASVNALRHDNGATHGIAPTEPVGPLSEPANGETTGVAVFGSSKPAIVFGSIGAELRERLLVSSRAKAVVDATHPYAENISAQVLDICRRTGVPLVRYERPALNPHDYYDNVEICDTWEQVIQSACRYGRRVFLSTGSSVIPDRSQLPADMDIHVRIAPDATSMTKALDAGISPSNIVAMQGPFSTELNVALWSAAKIEVVITKDSGAAGGLPEKLLAAKHLGMPVIILRRPASVAFPLVAHDFAAAIGILEEHGLFDNLSLNKGIVKEDPLSIVSNKVTSK